MYTLTEILSRLETDYQLIGTTEKTIDRVDPINESQESSLTFCSSSGSAAQSMIRESSSKVVICNNSMDEEQLELLEQIGKTLIIVRNPRL